MSWLIFLQFACLRFEALGAAPDVREEISKQYDFLVKGMDDQRQRLRIGVYRASGRFISDDPTLGRLDGPVTIYSAFDHDADKFRFERTEPIREGKITSPDAGAQAVWTKKTRGGQILRLNGRTTTHQDDSFMARSGNMTPAIEHDVKPLDVRAFGLFYWSDLSSIPSTIYPVWLEILNRQVPDEVVEERRGIWRITWTFPEYATLSLRRILWIDQNSGFSPIRTELRYRSNSMPKGFWPEPKELSETTWTEISGVWVPKTYRNITEPGKPEQQSYELAFDWHVVNGAVPADVFSVKGLNLSKNTVIADNSLGREFVVGSIGVDHSVIDRTAAQPPPPTPPKRAWQGWVSASYSFGAFGIVVLGLAAWLFFRSARKV